MNFRRVTNDEVYDCLRFFVPFRSTTGNLSARREGDKYTVYSYFTKICEVSTKNKRVMYWDDEKYSVTTTIHQNIVKRALHDMFVSDTVDA